MSPDEELAVRLRVTLARLVRRLRAVGGEGDLTASQLSALATIAEAGLLRIGDLASREAVTAPTMTRLVDSLVRAGLVRRDRDPADGRSTLVSPTALGAARLGAIGQERTAFLADRIAQLRASERRSLSDAVPVLEHLGADALITDAGRERAQPAPPPPASTRSRALR
jgi:DNA-binding MarR family transcriptional regulator